jgi:phospholipid/cholesterol/gamma-HCH transport system ATP-binding protein
MPDNKYVIEVKDIWKRFDSKWVSKGINLAIPEGKMTVIIGQSGEGKSVLLKQIIGLIKPTSGSIIVEGTDITKLTHQELNEEFKKFGYVFQFAALLDSLTVFENIGITLLEKDVPINKVIDIVKKQLARVNLSTDTLDKYPAELSGGMKKRVGLARTLVTQPQIILYDEPTTGLDPITAHVIHQLMNTMQQKLNITSVVVSHDTEIFAYADYVALLYGGTIRYFGDAKTIWESDNPYIYQFIRGNIKGPIKSELVYNQ